MLYHPYLVAPSVHNDKAPMNSQYQDICGVICIYLKGTSLWVDYIVLVPPMHCQQSYQETAPFTGWYEDTEPD